MSCYVLCDCRCGLTQAQAQAPMRSADGSRFSKVHFEFRRSEQCFFPSSQLSQPMLTIGTSAEMLRAASTLRDVKAREALVAV